MNKSYKIIFNSHSGIWVVVSELVSSRGKRCSSVVAALAAITAIGISNGSYADTALGGCTPTGGTLNEIGIGANTGTCVVQAGGTGAIGIGANVRAVTANGNAIAIGTNAQAEASDGDMLAIGDGARAIGIDSTALGGGTLASGQDSIAIGGNGSSATQTGATTLGYNSNATGTRATALGSLANASGENAVAISNGSNSASNNGVAIGAGTITTSGTSNGVAIGGNAASRAENAVALGAAANANSINALALGANSSVTLANSVALGSDSSATATTATTNWTTANGVVQGRTFTVNQAPTNGVVAVGNRQIQGVADGEVSATSTNAINGSQLFAITNAIADTPLGFTADSGTKVDRKLGETLKIISGNATGTATTNLKTTTTADGIEISFKETPTFKGADFSGGKLINVGAGSLAMGSTDGVNGGQLNTALGSVTDKLGGGTTFDPATGKVTGGFTVGGKDYNNVADAIAGTTKAIADTPLGFTADSGTKVDRKLGETLKIISGNATGTATTNLKTTTTADGIEISFKETPTFKGADFSGGKLINVGAGSLAMGSTDGVNGGQLNTALGSVTDKLGGGTTFDPATGKVTGGFTVGGKDYNNVADAIAGTTKAIADTPLTFAGNSGTNVDRKLGQTFNIKGAATAAGSYSGGNIKTVANGTDGIDIQLADAPVFAGQVKANGFDASGQKIVNVGVGTATTDAVNIGQLTTTLGGNVSYNADGTLKTGFTTNAGTYGSVAEAINAVNTTASKGWNLSTNGGDSSNVAPGATVDIAAGSSNVIVSNVGTNVKVDIAQELNLNSVKTGNTTMDSTGVAVGSNVKLGATGLVIEGGPSVTESGVDAGNKVVRNVEAGAVTEDSKDAVNGSQLYAVKQTAGRGWDMTTNAVGSGVAIGSSVANIAPGDTAKFTAGNNVIVTQIGKEVQLAVNPELKGLTSVGINGGPTLSSTGIAMGAGNTLNMGGNAITNVAAGTAGSDAVNLNQMTSAIAAAKTKYYSVNSTGGGNLNNDGATGADAIASGKDAIASKDNAIAIGKGATADTFNSVAIGAASKTVDVVATSKTSLGGKDYQYAGTTPVGTVSVGSADNERTITNVAAGRVNATSTDAINGSQLHVLQTVLSPLLDAGGGGQVGLLPPSAGGVDSANPGRLMTQTYGFNNTTTSSVKASDCQTVNGVDSTGVGLCVKASQKGTTALGSNAQATAENATAIGFRSTANGQEAVAVGYQNTAAKQSVAIGTNNTVTGEKSIAIGVGNTVASNRSIVIGDPSQLEAGADDTTIIGNNNTVSASANQSVSVGSDSVLSATRTVALGVGAQATKANSVALGAFSVTGNYARTQSVSIGSSTFAFAGSGAELSTVSVGRAGSERQIQNVAAGRISNSSTDAINGSQLYATNQAIETLQAGIGSVYETLNYLDGRITNVARDANAGSASAMAMASMPQAWEPNKTITSMGAATYQGESAYSMGVSRMSENGRVTLNFGATGNTRNKFGVGVGVGIQW
ncbi:YadA-like family protein [Methylophilus medardicus]|uniref:Adhesin n=1 Tax=Methylophilus medardicus TaxID=2588534 RepID=A0A5B8CVT2_9PROT|nr:YadA-like family protein [Methylophilus medardicus]QDC45206.1 hypothetical protein FIU01_12200 [Methylophilus medardicus]QDC50213.1 hypothetical protein FIU00_12200 [Methylophilus medardicus]QDC53918.1 hypothetical protein FIT99_12200 [Methylophilus medardicus]